jgi:hypothetical protein
VTFPESTLKTPKTDLLSQPHFLDAWATPQIHGQHTPAHTPSFTLSTPNERPSSSYSLKPRTPEDPEFHVNHFVPNNLPLPPVEVSRRLSSSPDPSLVRRVGGNTAASQLGRQRPATMDFSQMQTPPPTRDANSRRRQQHSGGNEFATPATVIHRTPNQMPTAEALFNQTPFGFTSNVQFSPSMMPFSNAGPMSVPPMPQSRLFWDQPNDGSHMDIDMPLGMDPFGPTPHKVEQNFEWQAFSTPAQLQMNSHSFQQPHGMPSPGPAASFAGSSMPDHSYSRSNSFVSTSASVDPSMLFSFSGPDMTTSFGNMPQMIDMHITNRQPYETQVREAQQEKEIAKKARSQHSRSNTNSSSGSVENTRPGLHRSNTDSGLRKSRASSAESRISNPASGATIPRRSSPLKRQSGGSLAVAPGAALTSIPEIRRPRTRLIIDETGRARTETVPVEDTEDTPRVVQRSSQKDVRRQYPGLWDEDETESENDELPPALSRNASFNIPQPQPLRRATKHARSDSGALERSNSFKIPRPSSRTSSGAFDKASFETVRPVRKVVENTQRRFSAMDLPTMFDGVEENDDALMPDSPGDALGALKKVVAGRQQRAGTRSPYPYSIPPN